MCITETKYRNYSDSTSGIAWRMYFHMLVYCKNVLEDCLGNVVVGKKFCFKINVVLEFQFKIY